MASLGSFLAHSKLIRMATSSTADVTSKLQGQTEENLVSSSSPNIYKSKPQVVCVAVQTPNNLLESLVANKVDKGLKPDNEHDAQIVAQAKKDAEKEFKKFAEKVLIVICENL